MAQHNELGRWGEEKAAEYLVKNGWYILERDWRNGHMDIDIIAVDEETTTLIFAEVKTRSDETFATAEDAVDLQKRNNILRCAASYIKQHPSFQNVSFRYDIISIIGNPEDGITIRQTPEAFDVTANYQYRDYRKKTANARYRHRPGTW